MNNTIEPPQTLALIATLRTFIGETLHPATTPADMLLLRSVRDGVAAAFREAGPDFPWYARWLGPLVQWFATWRMVTHLRGNYPDSAAALAAFEAIQRLEDPPPDQTTLLNPDLLALVRCPKDRQPLAQWRTYAKLH
jgi:hypothetical protein